MLPKWLRTLPALLATLTSIPLSAPGPAPVHPLAATPHLRYATPQAVATPSYTPGLDPIGHIPCDIAKAYGLSGGVVGAGVLIAIIDANDHPNAASDLAAFSSKFGLLAPSFRKYRQGADFASGSPLPAYDSGWTGEIALDIEWAHAVAPGASIALVEASSPSSSDLMQAVDFAVAGLRADVVSMSFGIGGPPGPDAGFAAFVSGNDSHFPPTNGAGAPVMYFASTGDSYSGVAWPAVSGRVVAVGGTTVAPAAFGGLGTGPHNDCAGAGAGGVTGSNETVWGTDHTIGGTGGGLADGATSPKPAWQAGMGPATGRGEPDVAMLADPSTGVAVFNSCPTTAACGAGWSQFLTGGTSLAAPMWAGVAALIDERRTTLGFSRLNVLPTSNPLYGIAASAFNDVITGASDPGGPGDPCGVYWSCSAAAGYDLVTGRGTPLFATLLALLTPPPAAPVTVTGTAGDRSVLLSWSAPAAGTPPIQYYSITGSPGGSAIAYGTATSVLVTGLTNDTGYTFRVAATNAAGTGPLSAPSATITPRARLGTIGSGSQPAPAPLPRTSPGSSPTAPPVMRSPVIAPLQVASPPAPPAAPATTSASGPSAAAGSASAAPGSGSVSPAVITAPAATVEPFQIVTRLVAPCLVP